jgi:hypothetical protein
MSSLCVAVGDYLRSATKLICVEEIIGTRAVVEDCLTGELLVVPVSVLWYLHPVRAAHQPV